MNQPEAARIDRRSLDAVIDGVCGLIVFAIGALNLWLVHPVPGAVGLSVSLAYVPSVRRVIARAIGLQIPRWLRIALAVAVVWFTLGVSDLGDLID